MNEELKIKITAVVNEAKQQIKAATNELEGFRHKTDETTLSQDALLRKIQAQKTELATLNQRYKDIVAQQGKQSAAATACAAQISTLSASYASNVAAMNTAAATSGRYSAAMLGAAGVSDKVKGAQKQVKQALDSVSTALKEATRILGADFEDGLQGLYNQLDILIDEFDTAVEVFGATSKEAKEAKERMEALAHAIAQVEDSAAGITASMKDVGKSLDGVGDEAGENLGKTQQEAEKTGKAAGGIKQGFAIAGKAAAVAAKAIVTAMAAAVTAVFALSESTREYRTEQAKLQTAFEAAGGSAEQATETYNSLYRVLGDSAQATEAANLLAQMTTNQEELAEWTTICQGAYATFGDSMPIESLAEAANETAKTGEITGALADAINWAGMSEDEFADALFWCNSEAEREELIRSTLNDLYGEAAAGYEENAASILAANEAQAALTAGMAALGEAVEPLATMLKAGFADVLQELVPSFKLVADGITEMTSGVEGGAEKLSEGIKGMIDTALGAITDLLPGLLTVGVDIIMALLEGINAAVPDILNALATIIPQIITALGELLPQITGTILNSLPMIIEVILQAVAQILVTLGEILPEILKQIVAILPQIVQSLVDNIPVVLQAAITFLMAIVDAIPEIIPPLIKALPQIIDSIITLLIENIPMVVEGAARLLMGIVEAIPSIVVALVEALPQIISSLIGFLLSQPTVIFEMSFRVFMEIVKAIPKVALELLKAIPQLFGNPLQTLKDGFSKGFENIWNSLTRIFNAMPDWFKTRFKQAVDGIKNVFNPIINFFSNIWNNIKNLFSKVGTAIGDGIKGAVTGAINKVLSTAVNIINGFISAINFAIGVINAIPGVNISKLDKLNVPKLARGGVVDSATLAMIGENGKEAVVPLENNLEWLDKLANLLNERLGGSGAPIILQVDGKTFGQIAVDKINDLTRQRGQIPLKIM